jgi:hypothetical protein
MSNRRTILIGWKVGLESRPKIDGNSFLTDNEPNQQIIFVERPRVLQTLRVVGADGCHTGRTRDMNHGDILNNTSMLEPITSIVYV